MFMFPLEKLAHKGLKAELQVDVIVLVIWNDDDHVHLI